MDSNEMIGAGILLLLVGAFVMIVFRMIMSLRFQFKLRYFIQFVPLIALLSAALVAYYQPSEIERWILYGLLLAYFIILIIVWYVKGVFQKRKTKKQIRRYSQ